MQTNKLTINSDSVILPSVVEEILKIADANGLSVTASVIYTKEENLTPSLDDEEFFDSI